MGKIAFILLSALMMGAVQPVSAQKWLKSVDRALKRYPANSGMSVYHNGIDAKFISCVRAGEQVWIDFELKNYASVDKVLPLRSDITRPNGERYVADYFLGGMSVLKPHPKITIPSSMTLKYRIVLRHVSEDCDILPKAVLGFGNDTFDFGTFGISEPKNTNHPDVFCDLPSVLFEVKQVVRDGKNIRFDFVMTSKEGVIPIRFLNSGNGMIDTAGNVYHQIALDFSGHGNTIELSQDVPVAGSIIVQNVPESVNTYSLLKCAFSSENMYRYYIRIKGK